MILDKNARKSPEKNVDKLTQNINILEMDVERLDFADDSFDTVVATCVFCSVPNPIQGLKEVRRVTKPSGKNYTA